MFTTEIPAAPVLAISLDLDDTLWPVRPTLIHAEQVLGDWMRENIPATAAIWDGPTRKRLRSAVLEEHPDRLHDVSFVRRRLLQLALLEAGDDISLADDAFEVFLAARQRVSLFDDVAPVLARWRERYQLIAVSNGNANLDRIGIGHWFSAQISAHEAGFAKPDRRIFELASSRSGIAAPSILHIGDDPHLDFAAAREAGMQSALLRRPELEQTAHSPIPAQITAFHDLHGIDAHLQSI